MRQTIYSLPNYKEVLSIATTRIFPLHIGKGRTTSTAIRDILDYVENPQKTDNGRLISSFQCDSRIADSEFLFSKKLYAVKTGRRRGEDDVLAYQIRQSFVPGEITPEEANRLGYELARRFTKDNHAFIVCTHIDKAHIHNHIIWNSTSLDHSRKFRDFLGSGRAVRRLSDTICIENGYSIVKNPKRSSKGYAQWLGSKPPSHREQLRTIIDDTLAQKPSNLEELLGLFREAGITVKQRGKSVSLQAPERSGFIRLDAHSMGRDYDLAELLAVLAGEKKPGAGAKKFHRADLPKVNLLVDMQAKLRAGKGAGYVRWASAFNLKQMAQTLNYLTEHKLPNYADLSQKAAEASTDYNDLSAKIKAAEKRMAEIAVLKTHIINYVKTREVYAAYRKAGYSKSFKAEHESEILLHQAAKKAFDEQGLKKLPTVKELQAEYAALLVEKKSAYAGYRKARDEMKALLTVKANVDRLMGYDHSEDEKDIESRNLVKNIDRSTVGICGLAVRKKHPEGTRSQPRNEAVQRGLGCFPNKQNERPASGRAFHFCKVGPTLPCLPVSVLSVFRLWALRPFYGEKGFIPVNLGLSSFVSLVNFLFQSIKFWSRKELPQSNFQAIT